MTDTRKIQLGVEVDPSGAKAGLSQVSQGAKDMAQDVNASGARAGEGLDKVGTGADRAAKKVDSSTRSMIASIERATAAAQAGERGTAQYFETLARQRGANADAIKPYIESLRQAESAQRAAGASLDKMGVSAAQTTAALRQVPAQFTDIVTSLQGGQAPLTVLLQQGGQLKDSFGGAGAAARALGGYIVSLINPLTVLAAAAGTLAFGFFAGREEAKEFNRSLVLTGNQVGATVEQLTAMAQRLDAVGTTQGKASEVLAQFARTGRVGAESLERVTLAAINLERVGGPAIAETVSAFADLGKDPLAASLKLNESTGFLTQSIYEQVKALTEQGRTVEAAKVAQNAYSAAIEERTPQIVQQLGYVERAWKGIVDLGREAIDGLKEVGRPETLADLEERRRAARIRVDAVKSGAGSLFFFGAERELQEVEKQIEAANRRAVREFDVAAAKKAQVDQVKALAEFDKAGIKFLTDQQRLTMEIAKARELGVAAGLKEEQIAARIAEITKAAQKTPARGTKELDQQAALLERLSGLTGTYQRDLESLQRARAAGTLNEQQYIEAIKELIEKQPVVVQQRKQEAAAIEQVVRAQERAEDLYVRQIEAMTKSADQVEAQVKALQDEEKAAGIAAAKNISLARAIQQVAIARLEERRAATKDPQELEQLDREIARRKDLIEALGSKELREAASEAAKETGREWRRVAEDIERSLTDALLRGFESGKSFAENLRDTLVNMFKTLVLRPTIQGVLGGFGLLGGGAANAAGSAAGGMGGIGGLGGLGGIGNLLGLGSTAFGGAAGSTLAGLAGFGELSTLGFGEAFSGGWAALTGGNIGGGLGTLAGAALPFLGAAALIGNAFGLFRSNKTVGSGITGTLGGSIEDFTVNRRGGTLFSGPSYSTPTTGISSQNRAIQDTFNALREQAAQRAGVLGLDAAAARSFTTALGSEKLSDDTGGTGIRLEGLSQDEAAKKIQGELEKANERLAESLLGPLQTFRKASETASQALERLSGIQVFSNNLNQLGSVFTRVAGLSFDARQQMIDLAGGIDAFSQQALGFVQNYYNRDEIAGLKAREIQGVLQGAGITTDINSREQFRAIVEGLDVSTEAGRKQLATLLGISGSFTSVADYLAETGSTLSQAAAGAPDMGNLGPLLANNSQQVAATNEVRDGVYEVRDAIERLTDYMAGWGGIPSADVGIGGTGRRINLPEVGLA